MGRNPFLMRQASIPMEPLAEKFRFLRRTESRPADCLETKYPTLESLGARVVAQHEGTKEFWVFADAGAMRAAVEAARDGNSPSPGESAAFLNELIFPAAPQKFRADFDGLTQENEGRALADFEEAFTEAFLEAYGERAGIPFPLCLATESHAEPPGKRSWHVIVHNVAFPNAAEVLEMAQRVRRRLAPEFEPAFDRGIYSLHATRTFRCLGCAKTETPARTKEVCAARAGGLAGMPDAFWAAARICDVAGLAVLPAVGDARPKPNVSGGCRYDIPMAAVETIVAARGYAESFAIARVTQLGAGCMGRASGAVAKALCGFRRTAPSRCGVCARTHDSDTPFLLVAALPLVRAADLCGESAADLRDAGQTLYRVTEFCHRAPGKSRALNDVVALAPAVEALEDAAGAAANARGGGGSWPAFLADRVSSAAGDREPLPPEVWADWPDPAVTPWALERRTQPNIEPFPPLGALVGGHEWRTLVVVAGLMMGKTQALCEFIEREYPAHDGAGNPHANFLAGSPRIIAVSCRRSFARDFLRRFAPLGFKSYEDIRTSRVRDRRVIVQVESLTRLDVRGDPPDVLIVDEAVSVVLQLCSPHVRSPHDVVELFHWLMRKARKVIFLDAFMGEQALNVLLDARGAAGAIIRENLWSRETEMGKRMEATCSTLDWGAALRTALRAGRKIAVLTNSLKGAKRYKEMAERLWRGNSPAPRVRLLTGGDTEAEKTEFFRDVDAAVEELDVLVCTPVMTAGVSINGAVFAEVFAHFSGYSCCAEICMQMLGRVRRPSTGRFVVLLENAPPSGTPLATSADAVRDDVTATNLGLLEMAARYDDVSRAFLTQMDDNGYSRVVPLRTFSARVWLNNAAMLNKSKNDFTRRFIELAAGTGIPMAKLATEACVEVRTTVRDQISLASDAVATRDATDLWNASDITPAAVRDLSQRRDGLSAEEKLEMARSRLKEAYALSPQEFARLCAGSAAGPVETISLLRSATRQRHFRNLSLVFSRHGLDLEVVGRLAACGAQHLLQARHEAALQGRSAARADLTALNSAVHDGDLMLIADLSLLMRGVGFPAVGSQSSVFVTQAELSVKVSRTAMTAAVRTAAKTLRLRDGTAARVSRAICSVAGGEVSPLLDVLRFIDKLTAHLFGAHLVISEGDAFKTIRVVWDELFQLPRLEGGGHPPCAAEGERIKVRHNCALSLTEKGVWNTEGK
jgi:hypothetical protein